MQRFANKVAFITGAASGIGRATAQRLASEGASLALCDINMDGLAETAETCRAKGSTVTEQFCNVAEHASCAEAMQSSIDQHGQLDILCNIAGISQFAHFSDVSVDDWQRMLAINLSSVFYLSQLAMPHLLKTKGNIVNLSSTAGLQGLAYNTAYCATKAGVANMTRSIAIEYAKKGVRVNALCPGAVNTPLTAGVAFPENPDEMLLSKMFPLMEASSPEEIAAAVAYLASEEARFVTGIAMPIDGGQTAG